MTTRPDDLMPTDRTTLRRYPVRGSHERAVINAILDEGFVCHVAFNGGGLPFCIPTGYGRDGDTLYLHGSAVSRMMRTLAEGADVCVAVTLVDGLVLARSAFHHSMNYRSVVVMGRATPVDDRARKVHALRVLTNHIVPDRWESLRPIDDGELAATTVLALPIEEASAKVRTGPPKDAGDDLDWPTWAGVLPLRVSAGAPEPDAHVGDGVPVYDVAALRARFG